MDSQQYKFLIFHMLETIALLLKFVSNLEE